jgi:DHA1 family multidrug resistance protein-like MFS transporter
VIGPGIGGFLADFGLKIPFLISAIVSLAAVIFSIVVLEESETKKPSAMAMVKDNESMAKKMVRSISMPYFVPLVITLVMSFGLMAYESVLGLFVDNQFDATPQQIALMITSTGIISVIVQLFVVERVVRRYGEGMVLNIFLAVAAIGFLLSLFASSYILFFGVTLLIFLATSILRPVLNTLISKMAGDEQGFAMGMNNAYMSIGNVLGPTLAGMLYDVQILYPFVLGLAFLVVTLIMTMIWQKRTLKQNVSVERV